MSTIRKSPFIDGVLGLLNSTQLTTFKGILNGSGTNVYKTLSQACALSNGVYAVNLQFDEQKLRSGILIITATKQAFIAYHRYQDVELYEINKSAITYSRVNEYCDINELRRIVAEFDGSGSVSPWETAIKDHVVQNGNTTEIGGNCEIDGNLQVNSEISIGDSSSVASSTLLNVHGDEQVHGEFIIDGVAHIQDPNGIPLFWVGTQAQFEALTEHTTGTIYFVQQTDNTVNVYRY